MLSRERVAAVIEHRKADRTPVYAWLRSNLQEEISEAFGSVEAFEDRYEFDLAHLFGKPRPYLAETLQALREQGGGSIEPAALMEIEMTDPDNACHYEGLREGFQGIAEGVAHHKAQRGRFVYVQTPGIFESSGFGIENHLMYLAIHPDDLAHVYQRQAKWNRRFAMNCLDLGVDMIHISDDWGAQNSLMFSPDTWWKLIYPHHKITCDAVRDRGAYLSLHSDGNVNHVLDGIVDLGYNVVHPYQESAGMSYDRYFAEFRESFVIMGGLDVQTTIGFEDFQKLEADIRRVLGRFREGGMIYCTSHFVQNHCSIRELTFAFDLIHDLVRQKNTSVYS